MPVTTRREIATAYRKWKERHPNGTVAEFAKAKFPTIAYSQVYNASTKRIKLNYEPRVDKGSRKAPTKELAKPYTTGQDKTQLFDKAIIRSLEDMEVREMEPGDRAFALSRLAGADKHNTDQKLIGHLKRIDAGVIVTLVRMFKAEATEEDCILAYKTALAKYTEEQKGRGNG